MNLKIIIIILLVHHVSIGRASSENKNGWFTQTTVGELSLPFTYELFEAVRNKAGTVKLWCAQQCLGKPSCFFFTDLGDKCILYVLYTDVDSTMQLYTSTALLNSTQVYRKQGVTFQKVYEIGTTTVTYDGAQTACADLGKEIVTFASVQEFQTLSQLIDASPVSGRNLWIGLIRQPDSTWGYTDGGPDIPELWISGEPNGDGECAHMWGPNSHQYKFNDRPCSYSYYYICQVYTLI